MNPSDEYTIPQYNNPHDSEQSMPDFQGPDDRNSDITFEQQPTSQPEIVPVEEPRVLNRKVVDPRFPDKLMERIKRNTFIVNRKDYYGNAIPLGSFCFAITFIIYGFYRCKVYKVNDTFLWVMIFLFGGVGQCTAGFLEFTKGRTFPSACYLLYGGYCLSHLGLYLVPKIIDDGEMVYPIDSPSVCAYYSAWVVIGFAIVLGAAKVNVLFLLQCLTAFVFFLLRAIGEGSECLGLKRQAAGILQVISGFFSLLVFFSQMINNETVGYLAFPSIPLSDNNLVDKRAAAPK